MLEFSLPDCSCVVVQFMQWLLLHGDHILLLCGKRIKFLFLVMMLICCSNTYKTEHDDKYYYIS